MPLSGALFGFDAFGACKNLRTELLGFFCGQNHQAGIVNPTVRVLKALGEPGKRRDERAEDLRTRLERVLLADGCRAAQDLVWAPTKHTPKSGCPS